MTGGTGCAVDVEEPKATGLKLGLRLDEVLTAESDAERLSLVWVGVNPGELLWLPERDLGADVVKFANETFLFDDVLPDRERFPNFERNLAVDDSLGGFSEDLDDSPL